MPNSRTQSCDSTNRMGIVNTAEVRGIDETPMEAFTKVQVTINDE